MSAAIVVRPHESHASALRRFKRAVERAGITAELRKRQCFTKPSDRRRTKHHRAVKRAERGEAQA